MKTRLALLLALVAAGCARPYSDLTPFACPLDGHCPAGLACVPNVGCAPAQVDGACHDASAQPDDPSTDCSPAGSGATCVQGRCEVSCSAGNTCPTGRVCSEPTNTRTVGVCLKDCSTSASCPTGMQCAPLRYNGRKGCIDLKAPVPAACKRVDGAASCSGPEFNCGFVYDTVQCTPPPKDTYCPVNASCDLTDPSHVTCGCATGFTPTNCDGSSCAGACTGNWGCKPDAATVMAMGCNDAFTQSSGTCVCKDGRTLPVHCGTPQPSCEQKCQ